MQISIVTMLTLKESKSLMLLLDKIYDCKTFLQISSVVEYLHTIMECEDMNWQVT